jgi:hypothetical protein
MPFQDLFTFIQRLNIGPDSGMLNKLLQIKMLQRSTFDHVGRAPLFVRAAVSVTSTTRYGS